MIFNTGDNRGGRLSVNSVAIAAGIIIPIVTLLILGVGITIIIVLRKQKHWQPTDEGISLFLPCMLRSIIIP
jgi:hypothetical protein